MAETKPDKKVQKTIQWDSDVWAALEKHNKRERINNMSAAANDAVRFALFPEHRGDREADMSKQFQQLLYSLNEHRKNTARDITILQESMMQFVLYYFMHTHQIPAGEQGAATAQAKVRLDEFLEELVRKLPKSRPMSEEAE